MAQRKLNGTTQQLKFKSGLAANINTTATKNLAVEGEPHWATDTDKLWVFDGSNNVRVHGLDTAVTYDDNVVCNNGEIVFNF